MGDKGGKKDKEKGKQLRLKKQHAAKSIAIVQVSSCRSRLPLRVRERAFSAPILFPMPRMANISDSRLSANPHENLDYRQDYHQITSMTMWNRALTFVPCHHGASLCWRSHP